VIGWLYDLLAERSERAGTAQRRRDLLASLEGEVIEIGAAQGRSRLNRDTLATVAHGGFDVTRVERVRLPEPIALYRPGIQGVAIRTSS
jgi:hypothetical protein